MKRYRYLPNHLTSDEETLVVYYSDTLRRNRLRRAALRTSIPPYKHWGVRVKTHLHSKPKHSARQSSQERKNMLAFSLAVALRELEVPKEAEKAKVKNKGRKTSQRHGEYGTRRNKSKRPRQW